MNFDWSRFTQTIKIRADIATIYNLWTTRQGIESWFLRVGEFSRPGQGVLAEFEHIHAGDTYKWHWHGYPDTVVERGEILEANGRDKMSFVFGKSGVVTVEIKDIGGGESEMSITQSEIPTTEEGKQQWHVGCATGWTFYRCNMKSILHGGVDIRNKGNDNDMSD